MCCGCSLRRMIPRGFLCAWAHFALEMLLHPTRYCAVWLEACARSASDFGIALRGWNFADYFDLNRMWINMSTRPPLTNSGYCCLRWNVYAQLVNMFLSNLEFFKPVHFSCNAPTRRDNRKAIFASAIVSSTIRSQNPDDLLRKICAGPYFKMSSYIVFPYPAGRYRSAGLIFEHLSRNIQYPLL